MLHKQVPLGIYEKGLPTGECGLEKLVLAASSKFDFVEMSVDETDSHLARLDWSREQRMARWWRPLQKPASATLLCA